MLPERVLPEKVEMLEQRDCWKVAGFLWILVNYSQERVASCTLSVFTKTSFWWFFRATVAFWMLLWMHLTFPPKRNCQWFVAAWSKFYLLLSVQNLQLQMVFLIFCRKGYVQSWSDLQDHKCETSCVRWLSLSLSLSLHNRLLHLYLHTCTNVISVNVWSYGSLSVRPSVPLSFVCVCVHLRMHTCMDVILGYAMLCRVMLC